MFIFKTFLWNLTLPFLQNPLFLNSFKTPKICLNLPHKKKQKNTPKRIVNICTPWSIRTFLLLTVIHTHRHTHLSVGAAVGLENVIQEGWCVPFGLSFLWFGCLFDWLAGGCLCVLVCGRVCLSVHVDVVCGGFLKLSANVVFVVVVVVEEENTLQWFLPLLLTKYFYYFYFNVIRVADNTNTAAVAAATAVVVVGVVEDTCVRLWLCGPAKMLVINNSGF